MEVFVLYEDDDYGQGETALGYFTSEVEANAEALKREWQLYYTESEIKTKMWITLSPAQTEYRKYSVGKLPFLGAKEC